MSATHESGHNHRYNDSSRVLSTNTLRTKVECQNLSLVSKRKIHSRALSLRCPSGKLDSCRLANVIPRYLYCQMSVAHDKVYLITNVTFPGHFLVVDGSMLVLIIASTSRIDCWHQKKDGDGYRLNPIGSPAQHQPNYSGTTTYSLKMWAEDKGKTFFPIQRPSSTRPW